MSREENLRNVLEAGAHAARVHLASLGQSDSDAYVDLAAIVYAYHHHITALLRNSALSLDKRRDVIDIVAGATERGRVDAESELEAYGVYAPEVVS